VSSFAEITEQAVVYDFGRLIYLDVIYIYTIY